MSTDLPEEYIANAVLLINDYGMLFGQITRKGYIPIKYVYSSHFKVSVNGNEADISITHSNKKIILEKFGLVEEFHINWEKMIDLIAN